MNSTKIANGSIQIPPAITVKIWLSGWW